MNQPIESAADLHRELTKRGLELRPEVGRDAALLAKLAGELGIPTTRFMTGLKASGKSAEDYLRALMVVAAPFAQMFREIWSYLSRHCAPKAQESLVVRFGFDGDKTELDWDQFRLMAQTAKHVWSYGPVLLWPADGLFVLSSRLSEHLPRWNNQGYRMGDAFEMAPIEVIRAEDEIGHRAREAIQSLIDQVHTAWPAWLEKQKNEKDSDASHKTDSRHLPELKISHQEVEPGLGEQAESTGTLAALLTNLLPNWANICEQWKEIPTADKQKAAEFFHKQIEPLLISARARRWQRVQEALDLLDLPFWRYRWHTYEVWAAVKALEALDKFRPQPVIKDGYITLDAASPALVAKLSAVQPIYAVVQGETKLEKSLWKRKAIKPDLRFSIDYPATNAGTISIVEFKQRGELDAAHASEVLTAYSLGTGLGGGVVLVNYDAVPAISIPLRCALLGDVHPGHPAKVRAYQEAVRNSFAQAKVIPLATKGFVLLDVSGSMGSEYNSDAAQRGLKRLVALSWVKVFRFNDGLETGGDLTSDSSITTGGGTQLGAALEQLFLLPNAGIPERLLVVTDGGHDHPDELLGKCGAVIECTPEELENRLDWLNER